MTRTVGGAVWANGPDRLVKEAVARCGCLREWAALV